MPWHDWIADNAEADRVKLRERLSSMTFNPSEGPKAARIYRRGWNDAIGHVLRELGLAELPDVGPSE